MMAFKCSNLSRTNVRNETNACKRKGRKCAHHIYKASKGNAHANWTRAVAKIKIETALKAQKREEIKAISHTVNRLLPKIQNSRDSENWLLSLGPRPPDIQICVLTSDGIGRAIIRICSDFGTSI